MASLFQVSAVWLQSQGELKVKYSIKHLFLLSDTEVLKMKRVLESLASSNDEKVQGDVTPRVTRSFDLPETAATGTSRMFYLQERRIRELEESLTKCKEVQEMVKGQSLFK